MLMPRIPAAHGSRCGGIYRIDFGFTAAKTAGTLARGNELVFLVRSAQDDGFTATPTRPPEQVDGMDGRLRPGQESIIEFTHHTPGLKASRYCECGGLAAWRICLSLI